MISGLVLDADALNGFATGSSIYAQAAVWTAVEEGIVLAVPTTVLASTIARLDKRDRAPLGVLLGLPVTIVDDLTSTRANQVGQLLADAAADNLPLGHAVRCAQQRGWPLLAGNATAAHQLDPTLDLRELP